MEVKFKTYCHGFTLIPKPKWWQLKLRFKLWKNKKTFDKKIIEYLKQKKITK